MVKIILFIVGFVSFMCILGNWLGAKTDPIMLNAPWVILVLCVGFYGIIEAMEEIKEIAKKTTEKWLKEKDQKRQGGD